MLSRFSAAGEKTKKHSTLGVLPQINGESSILRCYNGMALAKMNRHEDAVTHLRDAITADPHNPLARLELAGVLLSAHCLEEALQELQILKVPSIHP